MIYLLKISFLRINNKFAVCYKDFMMRKAAGIFLILTLCFNSVGYYGLHLITKNKIRQEIKMKIKQQVPTDELVKIEYSSSNQSEFYWIHDREFRYKGTMYDIVSREKVSENLTILHCVTDHQETQLFKDLDTYVKNNMDSQKGSRQASSLYSNLMFSLFPPSNQVCFNETEIKTNNWYHYNDLYRSPLISINFPPPKTAS